MTLLELLVKELPKHGGWPGDAHGAVQDKSGQIWFYKSGKPYYTGVIWGADPISLDFEWVHWDLRLEMPEDYATAIITREQYEAAIAAQNTEWDGEGFPAVGCECEREVPRGWSRCRINYVSSSLIVYQMMDSGNEYASTLSAFKFRPISTEAERKREEVAESLIRFLDSKTDIDNVFRTSDVMGFIDYISAGKIPGVELSK